MRVCMRLLTTPLLPVLHVLLSYTASMPYLPGHLANSQPKDRYRLIFDPADTTAAFIGWVTPTSHEQADDLGASTQPHLALHI